ncbi:MAG: alcohol dehydrogenase catalytic domain-containing protein [Desulfatiglandales bacterium]
MKALVVRGLGIYAIEEVPKPKPNRDEVLVQVGVAGFCRTDLKIIRHGHRDLVLPCIPGEEVVGTVVEMGEGVNDLRIGERVYIYPGISCKKCKNCNKGAENLCENMRIMGFHRPGGFAEYVTSPASSVIRIPEQLDFETAVFLEPLSCCLNALELGALKEGESVGIWGGGPAGNLLKRASSAMGANPTVIEPDPKRRAFLGGLEEPKGQIFDLCIVAVSSPIAYKEAISHLAPRGRLVVFSGLLPKEETLLVDFNLIHYLEQTIVGAYGCSHRHALYALELLINGRVEVKDLITHRLPLDQLETALDIVEGRRGMKVLIYPNIQR